MINCLKEEYVVEREETMVIDCSIVTTPKISREIKDTNVQRYE